MKQLKSTILILGLALTACQEGNITPDIAISDEMSFNVLAPGAVTKVTGNSFDALDQIGLYVTDYVDNMHRHLTYLRPNR